MRTLCSCLVALTLASGCVGSGDVPTTICGQIIGLDDRPLGPGLVIFERGRVHEGVYEAGALIDENGRWCSPDLNSGGTWGLHLFHNDYSYLPAEITFDDHQQVIMTSLNIAWGDWLDRTGLPTWPDQPDDATLVRMPGDDNAADNPVAHGITMTYLDDALLQIDAEFSDPNGDLSNIVAAYDSATGAGYRFNPPAPPDALGNFPDGVYTLRVFLDERDVPGETVWYFIMSDALCSNTPILTMTLPPR